MLQEAINRVLAISQRQGMLSTITYNNCHGLKIVDTINDFEDEASDDDSLYVDNDRDDESTVSDFDDESDDNATDNSGSDSDLDDNDDPDGGIMLHPPRNRHNRPLCQPDIAPRGNLLDQGDDNNQQDGDDDQGGMHQEAEIDIGGELKDSLQGGESFNEEQSADGSAVVEHPLTWNWLKFKECVANKKMGIPNLIASRMLNPKVVMTLQSQMHHDSNVRQD
jgi:hypothetical protein